MLHAITEKKDIEFCIEMYLHSMWNALPNEGEFFLGYQGGGAKYPVLYNSDLWCTLPLKAGGSIVRYWNCFGLDVDAKGSHSIIVEINPAVSGAPRKTSGLFAWDDETDDYFLLHRGRVGGGKKGIGKEAFMGWYQGPLVTVDDGGKDLAEVILIGSLTSPRFHAHVLRFVRQVAQFKALTDPAKHIARRTLRTPPSLSAYSSEFSGDKNISRAGPYAARCDHGLVVDALRGLLKRGHRGLVIKNNQYVDLAVMRGAKLQDIYEIKTSTDPQAIYTGIGQLLCHGHTYQATNRLLVLPALSEAEKAWLLPILQEAKISLVEFTLLEEGAEFSFASKTTAHRSTIR